MSTAGAGDGSQLRWERADFVRLASLPALIRGDYGSVKHMQHPKLGAVAVRELSLSAGSHKVPSRSEHEWQQLMSKLVCLHHPHVIRVLGYIVDRDYIAVVTDVAPYGSVKNLTDAMAPKRLPFSAIVRIIHQSADGMSYLHSQGNDVLHLDLCADNVLVANGLVTKLAGFGMVDWTSYLYQASAASTSSKTCVRFAPEVLVNESSASGKKCDVYAFALLIWELLAGKDPREGYHSPQSICEQVIEGKRPLIELLRDDSSPDVVRLMEDCWHRDPEFRPEFAAIVERTAEIARIHESSVADDESWLNVAVSIQQAAPGAETGKSEEAAAHPAAEAVAGDLHWRALTRAKEELIRGLRHPYQIASILDAWEMLDLHQYQHSISGCTSEQDKAAVLLQATDFKNALSFLAFVSALSITGQDDLRDRVVIPAFTKEAGSEHDLSALQFWMLVFKVPEVFAVLGTLNTEGFISDDDKTIIEAQPTRLQQAYALMVAVLGCTDEGLDQFRNELMKQLQSCTLDELLVLERLSLLRKAPLASVSLKQSAARSSSAEPTVTDVRSQEKTTTVVKEDVKETYITVGDPVFSKTFDDRGGVLQSDYESVACLVPAGAIKTRQELYIRVLGEGGSKQGSFSATYECGPSGVCFERPVHLTVPHCAPDGVQLVASAKPLGSEAAMPSAMDVKAGAGQATIVVNEPCAVTVICRPFLRCERPWWLFSRRRMPLLIFGFLYPNTGVARIYYAHLGENIAEISNNEFTCGGRYVQSQHLSFLFHPERGSLVFEESSVKGTAMVHLASIVIQESHGCVTLPMVTSAGTVTVRQELGDGQLLVFGDGSSTPATERAPCAPAGQIISTFPMKDQATCDTSAAEKFSSGSGEPAIAIQVSRNATAQSPTSIDQQERSRTASTRLGVDELSFGSASSSFEAALWCRDIAVSAEGTPLLAAGWDGLKEYDACGREIGSWSTTTELGTKEWIVAVDAVSYGRVAVGLWYSRSIAILRRSYPGSRGDDADAAAGAAACEWEEEYRVTDLRVDPWRVSAHGDYLAVAEGVPRNVLVLFHLPGGSTELHRWKFDHAIQCLTVTAEAVVTASLGKLKVGGGEELYTVDGYSHSGDRLWRWTSAEKAWDTCASPSGQVLYLALNDSDKVTAICATDGRRLDDVVTRSHGLQKSWRLSMSTGENPVLAVISYHVKKL